MFTKPAGAFDPLNGPAMAAFEFWASFWRMTPMFGVEWRCSDTSTPSNNFAGAATVTPFEATLTVEPAAAAEPARAVEIAPSEPVIDQEIAIADPVETARPVVSNEPEVPATLMVIAPERIDDLTAIKGIGPGLARQLNGLGVYQFWQLAGFSHEDLAWIDVNLRSVRGRCFREDWAGQAKALMG
ncbi:MAG TPA: hypothetical protein VLA52_17115 [Thermohalobaculum sp.]|nr:hypothetical protein [Thermohalobaculum sp.]